MVGVSRNLVVSEGWCAFRASMGHRHYGSAHTTIQDDDHRETAADLPIYCLVEELWNESGPLRVVNGRRIAPSVR